MCSDAAQTLVCQWQTISMELPMQNPQSSPSPEPGDTKGRETLRSTARAAFIALFTYAATHPDAVFGVIKLLAGLLGVGGPI